MEPLGRWGWPLRPRTAAALEPGAHESTCPSTGRVTLPGQGLTSASAERAKPSALWVAAGLGEIMGTQGTECRWVARPHPAPPKLWPKRQMSEEEAGRAPVTASTWSGHQHLLPFLSREGDP